MQTGKKERACFLSPLRKKNKTSGQKEEAEIIEKYLDVWKFIVTKNDK